MNNNLSELKKYLSPTFASVIPSLFFVFAGVCMLFVDIAHPLLGMLMMFALAYFLGLSYQSDMSHLKNTLKYYENNGELEKLLSEFESGHRAINDQIRVSDSFLFGKKTATIVRYDEIARIYLYVHRTNGVEDKRALKIDTTGGKTRMLCVMPTRSFRNKQDHPDVNKILQVVLLKNPSVKIGYK